MRPPLVPTLPELVQRKAPFRRQFHPAIPNNFVQVFVPQSLDASEVMAEAHAWAEPMNLVDGKIWRFCEGLQRRHPTLPEMEALQCLLPWRATRRRSKFPLSVASFESFSELCVRYLGTPIRGFLRKEAPGLLDELCQMPTAFVRVTRLNFFLEAELVAAVLETIAKELASKNRLSQVPTRVEVADIPATSSQVPRYPTLIFYPSWQIDRVELQYLMQWFESILAPFRLEPERVCEFGERWHPRATLTQGFRLYKRYLKTAGCLDRVYDRDTAYARALNLDAPPTLP